MNIRRLHQGDEQLTIEACRLFGAEGELDAGPFLAESGATLFIAEEDGAIVGWVYGHELIHPDGERTMLLYALDVAERARRRGTGKALVEGFVADARDRGCTEVWVLTDPNNAAALATYAAAAGTRDPDQQAMFTWKLADGRLS